MAFMKGATHNGFVTKNKDDYNGGGEFFNPKLGQNGQWTKKQVRSGKKAHPNDFVASEKIQRVVLAGLSNAFFRCYLYQEDFWKPLLRGEKLPDSMSHKKAAISFQYQNQSTQAIPFLTGIDNNITDLGGRAENVLRRFNNSTYTPPTTISVAANVLNIVERMDGFLDFFSPHGTTSVLYDLSLISNVTIYGGVGLDASSFTHLSFRISRVFNYALDPLNPANELLPFVIADLKNMTVVFNSNPVLSAALPINLFEPIRRYDRPPAPFVSVVLGEIGGALVLPPPPPATPTPTREEVFQQIKDAFIVGKTKSAMATVRIALDDITGLNKSSISNISIDFGATSGLVALDSFEFTN